jgi:SPP1 family predicted phage head-tail adaptor
MSAGSLRDRVRFEVRSTEGDEYGNPVVGAFAPQFARAVEIKPLLGSESVIAARLSGTQPVVIRTRFDTQTARVTPEWRAVDVRSGVVYEIRTAVDTRRRREFIEMLAVGLSEVIPIVVAPVTIADGAGAAAGSSSAAATGTFIVRGNGAGAAAGSSAAVAVGASTALNFTFTPIAINANAAIGATAGVLAEV